MIRRVEKMSETEMLLVKPKRFGKPGKFTIPDCTGSKVFEVGVSQDITSDEWSKLKDRKQDYKFEIVDEAESFEKMKSPKAKKDEELIVEDLPGVGSATAEKLSDAGYGSLMSIAVASPGELVEAAG